MKRILMGLLVVVFVISGVGAALAASTDNYVPPSKGGGCFNTGVGTSVTLGAVALFMLPAFAAFRRKK